ncbi:MAG: hypothetical protein AAB966_03375, partial [Patescibacteria group bacterium]
FGLEVIGLMVFLIGQGAMSLSLLPWTAKMSDIIYLKKKFNHRWKNDPRFMKDFDYEKPEYTDVPAGLKWALPIHECLEKPEVKERGKKLEADSKRSIRKNKLRLIDG